MQTARQLLGSNLRRFIGPDGRYDAALVARALDWDQKDLARFLGKHPSAISKNPTAHAHQTSLARLVALFDRVLTLAGDDNAVVIAWLRTPIFALDNVSPRALVLDGNIDVVERLVGEYESGLAL